MQSLIGSWLLNTRIIGMIISKIEWKSLIARQKYMVMKYNYSYWWGFKKMTPLQGITLIVIVPTSQCYTESDIDNNKLRQKKSGVDH